MTAKTAVLIFFTVAIFFGLVNYLSNMVGMRCAFPPDPNPGCFPQAQIMNAIWLGMLGWIVAAVFSIAAAYYARKA
jgi:hypothetical protein